VTSLAGLADLYGGNDFWFMFDVANDNTLTNWQATHATPGPGGSSGSSGFMTLDNPGNTDYSTSPVPPGSEPYVKTTYNNTYDPATQTFWMHYGYRAGVLVDQTGYTRQAYEKWVRK
jgi:hypothetical protein